LIRVICGWFKPLIKTAAGSEGHPGVTGYAGIHGDRAIGELDQLKVAILIFGQNHQNVWSIPIGMSLHILPSRYLAMAHVAASDEILDHVVLDGPL
jgi:hypothetical protein